MISSFGAFAAGFLMRPIGGILFGHIGDRFGRKRALKLSVFLMAIPTFLMGLLPTYSEIGISAAILLVFLRLVQGLSLGGEYTSSIVYLAESAPKGRRGLFTSVSLLGSSSGILLGSFLGSVLTAILTDAQLQTWGWRIPFLLGIFGAGIGMLVRRRMPETIREEEKVAQPLKKVPQKWREILTVCGLNLVMAVSYYAVFVFSVAWLVDYVQVSRSFALRLNTLGLLIFLVATPLFAFWSDRIGRKPLFIGAAAAIGLFAYPLIWLMHQPDPASMLAGEIGLAVLISAFMGPMPATLTEMFPRNIRVSAVSIGYNLTYAIFGGTTPMIAVWLIRRQQDALAFAWYIVLAAVISFIVALFMKDRSREEWSGNPVKTPIRDPKRERIPEEQF